jgi:predicted nucleic acid-binding protein
MIVADANLVAQLILSLDLTAEAQEIYRRDPDWRLPELWRHEFLNVLASYMRFDKVPADPVRRAWRQAVQVFAEATCEVDMLLALELAAERNVSAYDAQYVALARSLSVPLVTEDRKLRRAAPDETLSMKQFLSGKFTAGTS